MKRILAEMTSDLLPEDAEDALLVGRAWSHEAGGPIPEVVLQQVVFDISALAPTFSQLFEMTDAPARLRTFLYLGSLIAPTHDRGEAGKGFTHHPGDIVKIASPQLGCLVNKVTFSSLAPSWNFGLAALLSYLSRRGLAK
jgi:fumarylacetoacetate (FAA) hydrolase family protein